MVLDNTTKPLRYVAYTLGLQIIELQLINATQYTVIFASEDSEIKLRYQEGRDSKFEVYIEDPDHKLLILIYRFYLNTHIDSVLDEDLKHSIRQMIIYYNGQNLDELRLKNINILNGIYFHLDCEKNLNDKCRASLIRNSNVDIHNKIISEIVENQQKLSDLKSLLIL